MAVKGPKKDGKKLVQSRLQIGSRTKLTKCTKCGMTYSPSLIDDATTHKNYHELHLKGKKWSANWGSEVSLSFYDDEMLPTPPSSSYKVGMSRNKDDHIVMIRSDHPTEVRNTISILDIVNDELHAPRNENEFWCRPNSDGKAFIYIKEDRAVGVLTVELLTPERCRWMVYEDRTIVNSVHPRFIIGISRIWVCRTQRNRGIGTRLLEAARMNTIYGRMIEKWEMAWSQPTDSGGKLASYYNGVTHKTGKLLIPCYI